jgi:hypothetical protein
MADWLYALPDALIVAVFVGLFGGSVALLPQILERIPAVRPSAANTDFILRIQSTLFTMTGFALAFTLVQAQANYRRVEGVVLTEATQINTLDRLLTRYGDERVGVLRPLLLDYAQSIVRDEWPMMLVERESDATRLAFARLSRAITAIDAAPGRQASLYSEMLKMLDRIAESRDSRNDAAKIELPVVYWAVVWIAMIVLVAASGTIERTTFRTVFLTAQAAVLGALMGVVFITDHPMKGQTSVTPDALVRTIAAIKARTA